MEMYVERRGEFWRENEKETVEIEDVRGRGENPYRKVRSNDRDRPFGTASPFRAKRNVS